MAFDAFIKIDGIKGESVDAKHKDEIVLESFNWGVANAGAGYAGSAGRATGKSSPSDFSVIKKVDKSSPDLFAACASGKHTPTMLVTIRKASPSDFSIVKKIDKSSPDLFAACASGKHTKVMTVTVRKAGGKPLEYLVYKFSDVMVTSYQAGGSSQGDLPVETVSFNYAKVEIKYVPQDSKGAGMSPVGTGYDFSLNKKV